MTNSERLVSEVAVRLEEAGIITYFSLYLWKVLSTVAAAQALCFPLPSVNTVVPRSPKHLSLLIHKRSSWTARAGKLTYRTRTSEANLP